MMQHNSGVALAIVLIILVVLTLLGLSGMTHVKLDERVMYNTQDQSYAFQAAESGLADAENWLASQSALPTLVEACPSPPCDVWASGALPDISTQSHTWWLTQGQVFRGSLGDVQTQPYYVIEESLFVPFELSPDAQAQGRGTHFYRITARGTGGTDGSQSIVQSVYSIFFN